MAFDSVDPGSRVLDVGCGDGSFGRLLIEKENCLVIGIDLSEEVVRRSIENGVEALRLDIESEDLPFKDDEFDYVTCLELLEHLFDPLSFLRRLNRVARSYGVFSEANMAWRRTRLYVLSGRVPPHSPFKMGQHLHYWTYYGFRDFLKEAKFYPIEYRMIGGVPLIGRLLPSTWTEKVARLAPNLFGFVWKTRVVKD